ncbi:MAG: ABC transporter substrate-binding protein [Desulfobacterales bacterium]|jgi:branched-chain amino acid transport system substrate-binding protein
MRFGLLSMLCAVLAVGCLTFCFPTDAGAVRVGLLLPLSGPMASAGEAARDAAAMAAAETGTIDLRVADTAGTSEGGRSAARRLIETEQVHALAGAMTSPAARAAAQTAEAAGVPLLIFGASATAITETPWHYVFRINPPTEEKFASLGSFLDRVSPPDRATAVFCEDRPPAKALSEEWLAASPTLGLDPLYRIPFVPGLVDYRPELARARIKDPALMVLITAAADGALMLRQSREMNLMPSLVLGEAAGFAAPDFIEKAGKFGEYLCTLVPWAPSALNPGSRRFAEDFHRRFGWVPGHHEALSYAAMTVLTDAATRAVAQNRVAIREALAVTNLPTVCGQVRFDPKSARPGQNPSTFLLVQWQSGKLETIWPRDKASAEPVFPFPAWRSRPGLSVPSPKPPASDSLTPEPAGSPYIKDLKN